MHKKFCRFFFFALLFCLTCFLIFNLLQSPYPSAQPARAAVCPPEGCKIYLPLLPRFADQVSNGDFESGPVAWKEFSALNFFIILSTPGELQKPPHSGSWAAWLGGEDGETASIEQNLYISTARPYLHYWLWIVSDEPNCTSDVAQAIINTGILAQVYLCQTVNTPAWEERTLDLRPYAGQLVKLKFLVTTNPAVGTISSLYLDDISLQAAP